MSDQQPEGEGPFCPLSDPREGQIWKLGYAQGFAAKEAQIKSDDPFGWAIRAEKAEAKLTDLAAWMDAYHEATERALKAEAELAKIKDRKKIIKVKWHWKRSCDHDP